MDAGGLRHIRAFCPCGPGSSLLRVNTAQTWTLVGTVVALSGSLVGVIIAFMTTRFNEFQRRFDGLEGRMDRLEGRMDGIEGRIDGLEGRIDGLGRDVQMLVRHVMGSDAAPG